MQAPTNLHHKDSTNMKKDKTKRDGVECGRPLRPSRAAFTLVELLTVVAMIAVLASLLLTALSSAGKKARTAVSTSNLRQIALAINMYLDDHEKRPPDIDEVVAAKYLERPRVLLCLEDKTRNWGDLIELPGTLGPILLGGTNGVPSGTDTSNHTARSYLSQPLKWSDAAWDQLMRMGGSAGLSVCQLHGLGRQDETAPSVRNFEGLLLRAQRDGAVVRRHHFWNLPGGSPQSSVLGSTSGMALGGPGSLVGFADPWELYADTPPN